MKRTVLALVVAHAAAGVAVSAHHSFPAHYFEDQSVTIEGDLVQFDYTNPHAWVHVMAKDQEGATQRFSAEWGNPTRLGQRGVTKETLKPGDRVIITGSPGRNASEHRIHLKSIVRPADGWKWSGPTRR